MFQSLRKTTLPFTILDHRRTDFIPLDIENFSPQAMYVYALLLLSQMRGGGGGEEEDFFFLVKTKQHKHKH